MYEFLSKYISISGEQYRLLEDYYNMVIAAPLNLTSIKNKKDFFLKHVLDSVYIFNYFSFDFDNVIDVGSGGGFPGMVFAILFPDKKIFLNDSTIKKANFLYESASLLRLENVTVLPGRIEEVKGYKFDLITARGVSKVKELLVLTKNVSRETSTFIFYKGEGVAEEIRDAGKLMGKNKLGVEYERIEEPFKRTYTVIYSNGNVCWRRKPKS